MLRAIRKRDAHPLKLLLTRPNMAVIRLHSSLNVGTFPVNLHDGAVDRQIVTS